MKNENSNEAMHSIRIKLHPANLPGAEERYYARTVNEAELSVEKVCATMKTRGGFNGNYADLVNHVKQFFDEMVYQLCDGFSVNTGYFSVHPVVGGFFDRDGENVSLKGHLVSFRFHEGLLLRSIADAIKVRVLNANTGGYIEQFLDHESGTVNSTLTPGGMVILQGYRIRVRGKNPDCGVYFVSTAQEPLRVKVSRILLTNTARKIICIAPPDLPDGEYRVEVMTQCSSGGKLLKDPRVVTSPFVLKVCADASRRE